jgi:hypothetical protein
VTSKIEILAKQTEFLMNMYNNLKVHCSGEYQDFLHFVDEKIKQAQDPGSKEEQTDLQRISEHVDQLAKEFLKETDENIQFLKDQLTGIAYIRSLKDKAKEEEFVKLLLGGNNELAPTDKFKAEVGKEVDTCCRNVDVTMSDFRHIIEKDGPRALMLLLGSMEDERKVENDERAAGSIHQEPQEFEDDDSKCGSCPRNCSQTQSCGSGVDIFSQLHENEDKDQSIQEKEKMMEQQGGGCCSERKSPVVCDCGRDDCDECKPCVECEKCDNCGKRFDNCECKKS